MSGVSVKQLADLVGTPVEKLLEQLSEAGLNMSSADDPVSDDEKMQLLNHLRAGRGSQKLGSGSGKKITLKRKSTSELRQGKSGSVSVEVRKKRTYAKRSEIEEQQPEEPVEEPVEAESVEQQSEPAAPTPEEIAAKEAEEAARLKTESELSRAKAEAEAMAEAGVAAKMREAAEKAKAKKQAEEEERKKAEAAREKAKKKSKQSGGESRYGRQQLHVAGGADSNRRRKKKRPRTATITSDSAQAFEKPVAPIVRDVSIPDTITVGELAQKMAVKAGEVIKVMMNLGTMATINQVIDQDTAAVVVEEMGHNIVLVSDSDFENELLVPTVENVELVERPPVVTIMGHVDHGKTSLLDYIRRTKVVDGEAGGITQHIGAYHVETDKGMITFLDTPGHAAFTAMRARGADVTDIVILIVAADDGVMPQTKEAIMHAKAANVPLIVAINKIDRESADPDRVKNELVAEEVVPEEWGGENIFVNISAKTGQGIDDLLDTILLQSELLELKATDQGPARGVVVEASLDKGRGPIATLLVQEGTLRKGDIVLSGKEYGRVRAMFNESGMEVDEAGPSMPVVVLGLAGTPDAGDNMLVVADEKKAREVASHRYSKQREHELAQHKAAKLENAFAEMSEGDVKTLNILVKADVQGSAEALRDSFTKLSTDEVKINVVAAGVGGINESDTNLAVTSNAFVIGFNVRADASARRVASEEGIDIRYYSIIYEAIDDIKLAIAGLLGPEIREEIIGLAEVKDVFRSSKFGTVAGCMVVEGVIRKTNPVRVLRDNVVIHEGALDSLRRVKDDVNEVKSGTECGIGVQDYTDIQVGDHIEVFERTEIARTV
ncbi:MAG: translation initiation factor IF-2 [Gammaproteobacteria bacterium]|nr:translation initiation factor IF-2 [Gammaproteobacteria bacterium]